MTVGPSHGEVARPSRLRNAIRFFAYVRNHPANVSRPWRQVGAAARLQVAGRLLNRRQLVPIGTHSMMWADVRHGASAKVACANPPDWAEMLAWRKFLKPGDTFVDVGANVGTYTLWVSDLGVRAIAVEPDPAARALLSENLALNGYDVEVLPVALAGAPGTMRLTSGLDGANHLVTGDMAAGDAQEVPVETLDNVIGNRIIAGVKIDVEGAESLVLSGAQRALESQRIRCLQLEWNEMSRLVLGDGRRELARMLRSFGYRFFRPDHTGELWPVDDADDEGPDVFARPAP